MTNFTILKNEDILNTNISDGAFRCYSLLNQMCYGEKNTCFPAQQYLGEKLNKSIRSIQRYIIELVREGLITVKHRGSVSNVYTILNKITTTVENVVNKARKAYKKHFEKAKVSNFADYEGQRDYNFNNLEQMLTGQMQYDSELLQKE